MPCKVETTPLLGQNFSPPTEKLGTRHVQILLMFLGIAIAYAIRICMSVTIIAMTDPKAPITRFNWDSKTNSLILSSFFWGYIVTQVPSGYIANTRGAHKLLSCGMFLCSLVNSLIPAVAMCYGWPAVICCRAATGLTQACLYPCAQTLLSRWVPPAERARLGSLVMNAGTFGMVLTLPVSGVLCASRLGWPSVFYLISACGVAWSILFFYLGSDMPSEHPTICPNEMRYIDGSLGRLDKASRSEKPRVPWKAILTSFPMWAIVIVHSGSNWGFYVLFTQMPTYMKYVLSFDVQHSGLVSALPYLAMWLIGFPISWLSDFALRKGVSVECVRKLSNTIGLWLPAAGMLVLVFIETTDKTVLVTILVIAVGFNSATTSGYQINHIDLSTAFAGTMISITNSIANVFGIIAPLVCGVIIKDPTIVSQWHTVFYISAAVYFFTNLVFIIFGKAETQSWSEPDILHGLSRDRPGRASRVPTVLDSSSVVVVDHGLK
ncbi:putative inorganic phosphate cotransporter [Copidosoma floridanum]|uniref:putative inorganic phosphate cotransporter n=1 Tax=Copidosoma floridanum TaxID=29053 RepID=UPI000C6FC000|nr:putative inorganic phosphate cotransporter [Copidosoma floridanum]